MAGVAVALLVGVSIGSVARPLVDSYVRWKTAQLYARLPLPGVDDQSPVLRERRR